MKIALSAGHYPTKPGATNQKYTLTEHAEAVKIINHLHAKLAAKRYNVVLISGTLKEKVASINAANCGLAIELHFNADDDHTDPQDKDDLRGRGCMVMYVPNSAVRKQQADVMSNSIAQYMGQRNLGGREGWYWGNVTESWQKPTSVDYFLKATNCPAFIIEPGYIDNNAFAEKWLIAGRHSQIADAIFHAIEVIL